MDKDGVKFEQFLTQLDEVITNVSGAIDAKYWQMALKLVLVHKPAFFG